MKVKRFAHELLSIKESLQDKEVVIKAPNGEIIPASIKFITKEGIDLTDENVESIIITWE